MSKDNYSQIKQNNLLTTLITMRKQPNDNDLIYNNETIIIKNDIKLRVLNNVQVTTSSMMTLCILLKELTATNRTDENNYVHLSLKSFMKLKNIKSEDAVRRQLKKDILSLRGFIIEGNITTYENTRNKKIKEQKLWFNDSIIGTAWIKNGVLSVEIRKNFLEIYRSNGFSVMNIPNELFQIDIRYFKHTFNLGWKLCTLKKMNERYHKSDVVRVQTLLENTSLLEDFKSQQGRLRQCLIKPFQENMNQIPMCDWNYLDEENKVVGKDIDKIKFIDFLKLKISFNFFNYPTKTILSCA